MLLYFKNVYKTKHALLLTLLLQEKNALEVY